jgi:NADH-quinone oxidoreductase subunit M
MTEHLLSVIVWLPLLGAMIALLFPRDEHSGVRGFTLGVALVGVALGAALWLAFDPRASGMQLQESAEWIPTFGIRYSLGIDGISLLLVLLTLLLLPVVVLSTYSSVGKMVREYMVCLLLLQSGMLGAFLATDLFLFYVFWELMLIPMYFLIGIWGGQQRVYAALKFFLYTMFGSLLMLVAILYAVWSVRDMGGVTFGWAEVAERLSMRSLGHAERWLFLAFALAFAIKVPLFPFHTWLPDAHVEAPTGGSVVLAGVLLKLGTFGLLRYALYLFPAAAIEFLPALGLLAVTGIVYGALVAMVQPDLKRLVAYSSVSHLGFVVLGLCALTTLGVSGSVLQMVNHGISTAALFLLVGVVYERRHTRLIADFGGLAAVMPLYAFFWVLITMSSIGVPGLNGFVGEFLILLGTFKSDGVSLTASTGQVATFGLVALLAAALLPVVLVARALRRASTGTRIAAVLAVGAGVALLTYGLATPLWSVQHAAEDFAPVFPLLAIVAASGVIFAAVYLLWATRRVFFGPVDKEQNRVLSDLSGREVAMLLPLALVAVLMGVVPQPFIARVEPSVRATVARIRSRANLPMADAAVKRPLPIRLPKGFPRPLPVRQHP